MTDGAADIKNWTVLSLLNRTADYLQEKGFENARLNSERLLAHTLGLKRVELYLQFDRPLRTQELDAFRLLLRRRAAHEPLQYLLGECEFMSLPLSVGPGVLIPRPETEVLAEKALAWCRTQGEGPLHILDAGTGSGCLAITLAVHLPAAQVTAAEVSPEALVWARKNRDRHGLQGRVTLEQCDLRRDPPPSWQPRFDLVVSNPPYVRRSDCATLPPEIRAHEPVAALDGGEDGLDFYRLFARRLPQWLRPGGCFAAEFGDGQAEAIRALFNHRAFMATQIHADLTGRERILITQTTGHGHE